MATLERDTSRLSVPQPSNMNALCRAFVFNIVSTCVNVMNDFHSKPRTADFLETSLLAVSGHVYKPVSSLTAQLGYVNSA